MRKTATRRNTISLARFRFVSRLPRRDSYFMAEISLRITRGPVILCPLAIKRCFIAVCFSSFSCSAREISRNSSEFAISRAAEGEIESKGENYFVRGKGRGKFCSPGIVSCKNSYEFRRNFKNGSSWDEGRIENLGIFKYFEIKISLEGYLRMLLKRHFDRNKNICNLD